MVKVRPADQPKQPPSQISISAARNEYEPFQVVVRSPGGALRGVDVDLSDFHGGRGAKISCENNCTIYRELYIRVTTPSGPYGSIGEWPDALIPKIDRYAGERRNAFPFDVPQDRNQPIWVEVYVPADAQPGEYTASLKIQAQAEQTVHIPVQLTVRSFVLPPTSSIKNTFLVWGGGLPVVHGRQFSGEALDELVRLYSKALLLHRLSNGWLLGGLDWQPTELVRASTDDLRKLHAVLSPFFDGSITPSGGKVTAVVPPTEICLGGIYATEFPGFPDTNHSGAFCRPDVINFVRSAGWVERLLFYLRDEPNLANPAILQQVRSDADAIHQRDRDLRTLVTHSFTPLLQQYTDAWIVPLAELDLAVKDGSYWSTYVPERNRGKQVWTYNCCQQHGCGTNPAITSLPDWPTYMIDMQGVKNRVQDWVNWVLGVDGELYWGVNGSYYWSGTDPFLSQLVAGGNGDGSFFYPGTPARIGGKTHIPIESIRLKIKREGLEDYEYLAMLAGLGGKAFADATATRVARSAAEWDHDPANLYNARNTMANQIESLLQWSQFRRPAR